MAAPGPRRDRRGDGRRAPAHLSGAERRSKANGAQAEGVSLQDRQVGISRPGKVVMDRALTLEALAALIRTDAGAAKAAARWRSLPLAAQTNEEKFGAFASVFLSGPWQGSCRAATPEPFSRLFGFDVDRGTLLSQFIVLETLAADPHVVMAGQSASGGHKFWCVVRGPDDADPVRYKAWRAAILAGRAWKDWVDPRAPDLMRRRFIAGDPNLYTNWDALPVECAPQQPKTARQDGVRRTEIPPATIHGSLMQSGSRLPASLSGAPLGLWKCTEQDLLDGLRGYYNPHVRDGGSDRGWFDACFATVRAVQAGCIDAQSAWRIFDLWSQTGANYNREQNLKTWQSIPPEDGRSGAKTWRSMRYAIQQARKAAGKGKTR